MQRTNSKSGISRRIFLSRSARLGAAGVALPYFIPSGVLAAPGQPGANDRIGLAVIGIGRQATSDLQGAMAQKEVRYVAVADVNLNRAKQSAAKYGAEPYEDFRKMLERKDIDAIITATPEHWRSLICILACQAGKDLYIEKPMSLTIGEGRLMVEAARKYKRVVQVGSQQRSMWANHAGCELVRTGKLGKITRVIAHNYPSPWEYALPAQPIPDGLNWELWCGPTEVVPYNKDLYLPRANPGWLSFRPYSGGEMTGWGAHGFDQVQWALGLDETGPTEVWTEGTKYNPPTYSAAEPKSRGDKICSEPKVFMRYPGDIIMELGNGPMGGAIFIGEKGKLTIDRAKCESDPEEIADAVRWKRPADYLDNHIKDWLNCIKSREKPRADVEIGHRSATVCHLGNIARWTGRKLKWDPVKEIFPEDKEANQLLMRTHRKGYELPKSI